MDLSMADTPLCISHHSWQRVHYPLPLVYPGVFLVWSSHSVCLTFQSVALLSTGRLTQHSICSTVYSCFNHSNRNSFPGPSSCHPSLFAMISSGSMWYVLFIQDIASQLSANYIHPSSKGERLFAGSWLVSLIFCIGFWRLDGRFGVLCSPHAILGFIYWQTEILGCLVIITFECTLNQRRRRISEWKKNQWFDYFEVGLMRACTTVKITSIVYW